MASLYRDIADALAAAMKNAGPGITIPQSLPVSRGRIPGKGDLVCTYSLQAVRGTGLSAQTLACRTALNLPLAPLGLVRAQGENGFINLYLSDRWYADALAQLRCAKLQCLADPVPVQKYDAMPQSAARFLILAPDGVRMMREDPEWYLRRSRENPLYAIRWACRRAGILAARTDTAWEYSCMTPAYKCLVYTLDACTGALSDRELLGALRRAAEEFRTVYVEEKPGFRAGMLAAAVENILRRGLEVLGLEEEKRE